MSGRKNEIIKIETDHNHKTSKIMSATATTMERVELRERYEKRMGAIEKHQLFLRSLTEGKPKGIKTRTWFVAYIKNANKVFETEQEEYKFVNKYYRGQWDMLLTKGHLKKEEQDRLSEFARDFGAMDY